MKYTLQFIPVCAALLLPAILPAQAAGVVPQTPAPLTLDLWSGRPPGPEVTLPPEADTSKPGEKLVAGRPVLRLGNVSHPQITVYRPAPADDTGTAIIIAPGGGHWILAYDLEGTEIAAWLNSLGITGIVLKYRVPGETWNKEKRWEAAVQDTQRAVSLVRSRAPSWNLRPDRIGLMGFSAGAQASALTALLPNRQYPAIDAIDEISCRPDFLGLIYGGSSLEEFTQNLSPAFPPTFLAIAHDDQDRSLQSAAFYLALKKAGVPAELHIFASGGHGYGLRPTDQPVTRWPRLMADWLHHINALP